MSKSKLTQLLIILIIIAALGTGGYFGYKEIKQAVEGGSGAKLQDYPELSSGSSSDSAAGESQTYTHPDYGFTLRYPGNLNLGRFPEGEGEIILFQDSGGQEGFQIFISSYEEEEPLSLDLIKKQAPDFKISGEKSLEIMPADVETGEEALVGFVFNDQGDTSATHEVWFVAGGNLYQCTSLKEYGEEMEEILKSLTFN